MPVRIIRCMNALDLSQDSVEGAFEKRRKKARYSHGLARIISVRPDSGLPAHCSLKAVLDQVPPSHFLRFPWHPSPSSATGTLILIAPVFSRTCGRIWIMSHLGKRVDEVSLAPCLPG